MADLQISIGLDGKAVKPGADEAKREIRGVGDEAEKTGRRVSSLAKVDFSGAIRQIKEYGDRIKTIGSQISGIGQTLSLAVTTPLVGLATLAFGFTAMQQRAELSFKVLLRDGEKAKLLMKDLTDFADKTPFESQEIIDAGRKMVAFGIDSSKVKEILTDLGDTAAAMEVNIVDVASAFGRLKAGDFGEAFERFRDFGISRELLEAKGLKFDKSGQYKGSVEQAMTAVRAVMKEKFGGTMDELSNSISGKFSTVVDKAKGLLIKLFEPAQPILSQQLDNLIDLIQRAVQYFEQASPQVRIFILAVGAIAAAAAPVLVVIGTLIAFLGSVVTSAGTLIGIFASVGGALATFGSAFLGIGGFIVSFIGLIGEAGLIASFTGLATVVGSTVVGAIGSFLTALAPIVVGAAAVALAIGGLIAVGVALYAAWQTNFGGLRDFTDEVFNGVQQAISVALAYVQNLWATYGNQIIETATNTFNSIIEFVRPIMVEIVGTIREGFRMTAAAVAPLMLQIFTFVKTHLTATAIVVKAVLASISQFWQQNGEQIKNIVSAVWTILKTVVIEGIRQIANVITLILAIINGDWKGAWTAFKTIMQSALSATTTIFKSLGTIILNALKLVATAVFGIGKNIVDGLINGIKSGAAAVYGTVSEIAGKIVNTFQSVLDIHSPSRETAKVGEFITEGLAVGIQSKESVTVNAAKKVSSAVIKAFKDAQKEFNKLAGASPQTVKTIQDTNRTSDAASAQQEIIKLRGELGVNTNQRLPRTVAATEEELRQLQELKKNQDEYNESVAAANDLIVDQAVAYRLKLEDMRDAGVQENLRLREEIELIGVTDETERRRIQNYYEILNLREQMVSDGYSQNQIDEAAQILQIEQARKGELLQILNIRKQVAAAKDLGESLTGDLSKLQNGNRELSVYEQTLKKISTDLKDISPEQQKYLLDLATQIDQQKIINEQYKQTFDFLRDTFDVLTDSSTTFGEKLKSVFGGIFQSFKKLVLDMSAQWLTSKLFGGGSNSGSGGLFGDNQGGGIFSFLSGLFGNRGGSGSGGGSTGGGILGTIRNLFGGGSSTGSSAGGFSLPGIGGGNAHEAIHSGSSSGSSSGIGLAGGIAIAGTAANIIGGLIGGRAGGFLSNIGSGAAIGAQIGSIIPGIGTLIGAGVGAVGGFLASLFGGDPKRKRDKNEKLPQLNKNFTDALAQLRALGADKNAFYNDPEATIAKAVELRGQIASGFGLQFESKKYQKEAQSLIAQKLTEADSIISDLERLKNRALRARDVDSRLQTSFATGVYLRDDQMGDMKRALNFKRRNGMLAGNFTGIDTLPSMLAKGEMVLNPMQIQQVILNAGGEDPFRNANIPGYATGAYIAPSSSPAPVAAPVSNSNAAQNITIEKISLVIEGEGISNVKVKEILIDNLKKADVQVEVVNAYDKGKSRTR